MSYGQSINEFSHRDVFAVDAAESERAGFIRNTYAHVFGAILGFIGISALFQMTPLAESMTRMMIGVQYGPIIVMVAFMAAGWLAQTWAHNATSRPLQYLGLALYTVAEAVFFVPLLYIASRFAGPDVVPTAGFLTLVVFGGLTAVVMVSGADFSFLRTALVLGGIIALCVAVAGAIFGFSLGLWFSVAMVALASGYILYDTSEIMHHYRTDQHVGAALELFASVALLFYHILMLLLRLQSRD